MNGPTRGPRAGIGESSREHREARDLQYEAEHKVEESHERQLARCRRCGHERRVHVDAGCSYMGDGRFCECGRFR